MDKKRTITNLNKTVSLLKKMQEYYFLFSIGILWTLFAVIQDLKTREVSNWLNFSFVAFALSYRAFYASLTKNLEFFLLGLLGFALFFALAYAFYYSKIFAGGDAKLLMGYGAILPFASFKTFFSSTLLFIFALFLVGASYSLFYSIFIVIKNKKQFKTEFKHYAKKNKYLLLASALMFLLSSISGIFYWKFLSLTFVSFIPLVYIYTKSLDRCMLKLVSPNKLTEGDWLEKDIHINKKNVIKKTVHGLSLEDIKILKKYRKSVLIKEGIPFTPSFLLTLLIMVSFFLFAKFSLPDFFSFLF